MIALQTSQYHYHWPNYQVSNPPFFGNIESIKKKILHQFLGKMRNYHGNNKNMTDRELINFLREISAGGPIGTPVIDMLNNLNFNVNNNKSDIGTGASFNARVEALEPWIPDEAERINSALNGILDDIIYVLSKSGLDIIASQLKQVQSKTPVSTIIAQTPFVIHNGVYPETQLSLADFNVKTALENLQEKMQLLSNISSNSNNSGTLSLDSIQKSIAGSFNDIGGELFEPVVAHAINLVGNRMIEEKKKIDSAFVQSGGILKAVQSGNERKTSGAQKKNDIELTYTKDKITYSIGGTVKLRQGKTDLNGRGWLKDIHSGLTLGRLVELTLENAGQSSLGQYYAACLGAIKTTQSNRSRFFDNRSSDYNIGLNSWIEMKNAATLSGLALGLSGTGEYGDFSGVLVYNNIIYSIYDLLEKALYYDNNGIANITGSITPANLFSQDTFNSVHQRILNTAKELNKTKGVNIGTIIGARQRFTASEIQELWNKKVEINFSFANLVY